MDALLEKLRREKGASPVDEDRLMRQKDAWIADLESLMSRLRGWLAKGEEEGLIRVESRTVELAEEDLGAYQAPALTIRFLTTHPRKVQVDPRGLNILGVIVDEGRRVAGVFGRVDLTCGASRAILVRVREGGRKWMVVARDDLRQVGRKPSVVAAVDALVDNTSVELDEETFSKVLAELLE